MQIFMSFLEKMTTFHIKVCQAVEYNVSDRVLFLVAP